MTGPKKRGLHQPPTGTFRSDIQGLRAVAVLLVMVAHAGFGSVAGGFVGVDLFFVVSGYLIIGLLVREVERDGRISIVGFYARRARRIIPAATVVLVATAVIAALYLPLIRAIEVLKDAIWASLFGANIHFALVETDYFAGDDPASPLQHFWSLSVEEQFYVVIPVLLLITVLAARRTGGGEAAGIRNRQHRWQVVVLIAVSLLSLGWSVYATSSNAVTAYFSTPARAWELGFGGLLAVWIAGRPNRELRGGRWQAEMASWLGVALIGFAVLTYDGQTTFPGSAALLPVLGAVLLLGSGASRGGPATMSFRLLSLRPVTTIGDWSYSLYLWHWPVFQFAHEHWGHQRLSVPHVVAAVALTFVLSGLTYRFVEEPFRRGRTWRINRNAVVLYPLSLVLVVGSALGGRAWIDAELDTLANNPPIDVSDFSGADLSKDPAVALVQASVLAAQEDAPIPGRLEPSLTDARESIAPLGTCDYRTGVRRLCPTGDPAAKRSIVLVGDSHARAWGPAFTLIGKQHGYAVYHLVLTGCPANRSTTNEPGTGHKWQVCADFQAWALEQVADLDPALAVIANNAYLGAIRDTQMDGLAWEIEQLQASADRVVLLGNMPQLPRMPSICLSARDVELSDCLMRSSPLRARLQRQFGEVAVEQGAEYVDARRWFCADGWCPAVIGNFIPMRDKDHPTVEYAEHLTQSLTRALDLSQP